MSYTNESPSTRKSSAVPKVLITIAVVLILILAAAEFGTRWFIKGQISQQLQAQSGTEQVEDPKVGLGSSSVLLGLVQQRLPHLDIDIPSSLDVSYEDNDQSKPVVTGVPKTSIKGRDFTFDASNPDNMVIGDLTIESEVPREMMLAEINKATSAQAPKDNPFAGLIQVTNIEPNVDKQTLQMELTSGLATLAMKPKVENDQLTFDVDGVRILGQTLPDNMTEPLRKSLEKSATNAVPGSMRPKDVRVTEDGMAITMVGQDVNMSELESSIGTPSGSTPGAGSGETGAPAGEKSPSSDVPADDDEHLPLGSGGEIFNT